jgi:hypothetical protein
MDKSLHDLLYGVGEQTIAYLPSLFAGIVLMGVGWLFGWLLKRVVIQVCVILHLDRLLRRFKWGYGFAKADVRYALYDWIGSVAGFVVFLVFLNAALAAMQLTVLSHLLERGVLFIPNLIIALIIFGVGSVISGFASSAMLRALVREEIPRSSLIARFAKLIFMLFFSAMALTQLGLAQKIVLVGFTAVIITLCLLTLILLALSGRTIARQILDRLDDQ